MEKGMSTPLSDLEYYNLMTDNGTNRKQKEILFKYYPELSRFNEPNA